MLFLFEKFDVSAMTCIVSLSTATTSLMLSGRTLSSEITVGNPHPHVDSTVSATLRPAANNNGSGAPDLNPFPSLSPLPARKPIAVGRQQCVSMPRSPQLPAAAAVGQYARRSSSSTSRAWASGFPCSGPFARRFFDVSQNHSPETYVPALNPLSTRSPLCIVAWVS